MDKKLLYGSIIYPDVSPVCIAAFHSDAINEKGGKVII